MYMIYLKKVCFGSQIVQWMPQIHHDTDSFIISFNVRRFKRYRFYTRKRP